MRGRTVAKIGAALLLAVGLPLWFYASQTLPHYQPSTPLPGLQSRTLLHFGRFGVPAIEAASRRDAYQALGFVIAGDRLFQMDMLRRSGAGRLAEVLGAKVLESDRWHRLMGFERVAATILAQLPPAQREILQAYGDGVNQALAQLRALPPEFALLGYRPEPWRPTDTVLAVLRMHEMLNNSFDDERMLTVMSQTLAPELVSFLTPRIDRYGARLLGIKPAPRPALPVSALRAVLTKAPAVATREPWSRPAPPDWGSNAWVVGPNKTRKRQALLANDPHLRLGLPNIWYRVELSYPGAHLIGATLPGVPALVSGSNGKVAWGYTNVQGDFLDLVQLDMVPGQPSHYLTPDGPEALTERQERIGVRHAADDIFLVRSSRWGPVPDTPVAGRRVAVHWLALDPSASDFGMLNLDAVADVHQARELFNNIGGPPQNVMLADAGGNIAWTLMGRIPRRVGMDGSVMTSWADGKRGWSGYLEPDALPFRLNPPEGFLVTANQRTVPLDHPYVLGHNFSAGYRAYRISQQLRHRNDVTVDDMLRLQLDTRSEFYRYYQRLALRVIAASPTSPQVQGLQAYLRAWDGHAGVRSLAFPLLVEFRNKLLEAVLTPFMAPCKVLDPAFVYQWRTADEPLRALLDAALPELLPEPQRYKDWSALVLAVLQDSAASVLSKQRLQGLGDLNWGQVNRVRIAHPFSQLAPGLGSLLDMHDAPLPGCAQCVRVATEKNGASERLVVAPGDEQAGILEMPGGQSGNVFSAHYGDQQAAWVDGLPAPLGDGPALETYTLMPAPGALP